MASKVELCNISLRELGRNSVTDIDSPSTNEEKVCNTIFDVVADEVMAVASWTSVIKRATLSQTMDTPAFEFLYTYQLPTSPKCLHVVDMHESRLYGAPYVIEGDKLLTNSATANIRYRARISTTDNWDVGLTNAFIDRLTSKLALILTGSKDKADTYYQKYLLSLKMNLAENNQQGSQQYTNDGESGLTDVR